MYQNSIWAVIALALTGAGRVLLIRCLVQSSEGGDFTGGGDRAFAICFYRIFFFLQPLHTLSEAGPLCSAASTSEVGVLRVRYRLAHTSDLHNLKKAQARVHYRPRTNQIVFQTVLLLAVAYVLS